MHLFDDIKSPLLLYLKGGLFLLLAIMAGTLTVYDDNRWREIVFLAVCVWASCRFYYFLFYVLDHYVGGDKNASVSAMILKSCGKRQSIPSPVSSAWANGNLFADVQDSLPEELVENLAVSKNVHIERIISTGQASSDDFWYDQDESEPDH